MTGKIRKVLTSSKPIRMWIDGKCFNIKGFKDKLKGSSTKEQSSLFKLLNDSKSTETSILTKENQVEDSTSLLNSIFAKDDEGQVYTAFTLPKFYYKKLLAQTNFSIKTLAERTNTEIVVPAFDEGGKLNIKGNSVENLTEALNEILSVIGFIRDSHIALQFANIPLISEEIQLNFEKFKKDVLESEDINNIDESVFMKKEKLHLTINVFVLQDETELQEAINALNDYTNSCLIPLLKKTGLLKIQVKGIDCMNSNYKRTNVVYAKAKFVNETEEISLQKIADDLSRYFYERGLLNRYQESVKIHMTLINVKYRKPFSWNRKRKSRPSSIDATRIMEKYRDYNFGVCDFNKIKISQISAPPGKDGFYKTLSEVELNLETNEVSQVKNVERLQQELNEKMDCDELTKHENYPSENQSCSDIDTKDSSPDQNDFTETIISEVNKENTVSLNETDANRK